MAGRCWPRFITVLEDGDSSPKRSILFNSRSEPSGGMGLVFAFPLPGEDGDGQQRNHRVARAGRGGQGAPLVWGRGGGFR
mmetsp:Transcript_10337/g.25297  ORF Transcript_10337/g.25297 Transcript_10337/m.25297 type:complete len:80 (+) Transcript_10337:1152-1391(+)